MTDYKSIKYNISGADLTGLTAGQIPNLDTAKITTGTMADARISSSSVVQHSPPVDLTPVRYDILTLALKQAVQENSTKFNLPNSAIVKFEADADFNLAGSTNIGRNALEYISPTTTSVGAAAAFPYATVAAADRARLYRVGSSHTNSTWLTIGDGTNTNAEEAIIDGFNDSANGTQHANYDFSTSSNFSAYALIDYAKEYTFSSKLRIGKYATWGDPKDWHIQYSTDNASWTDVDFSSSTEDDHGTKSGTATDGQFVSATSAGIIRVAATTDQSNVWGSYVVVDNIPDFTARYFRYVHETSHANYNTWAGYMEFVPWYKPTTIVVNATGTALGTTNVPTSAVTSVSGVLLLKNAYGTNVLGTDVKAYFTADNSNWTEAASYTDAGTFSTGIKMIKLGNTTVTSGSDVRWKLVWANQVASTKEGNIYGIGLNY